MPTICLDQPDQATLRACAEQRFAQGVRQQATGCQGQARASFEQALALWPECAAAWANLGLLHDEADEPVQAERAYRQALALDATLFEPALNLATLLAQLKRFDEAEQAYRQAIALRPGEPAAWSNLGAMLACLHRDDDALACCQQALALDPAYDKARFNMAYPLLRQGRLHEGGLCNEAREGVVLLQAELTRLDQLQGPRWTGDELAGRTLLIVSDAGHGDLIQMARYARFLKARGAAGLLLLCQPALQRLLGREAGFDQVFAYDEPVPRGSWQVWAPLMSLPYLCGTELGSIPAALPYLQADPARVAQRAWQMGVSKMVSKGAQVLEPAALQPDRRPLRVGLVWRGNPLHENDADRSLPSLSLLAPLGAIPGVHFVSLQSGAGQEDALSPPEGLRFQPLAEPLGDFAETAAVIANLDLVIGVDTSIIHLAGALGKPVWVLLPHYKADWRWLQGRDDSPWYPCVMRLFRQARIGDWAPVVAQLVQALQALAMPADRAA